MIWHRKKDYWLTMKLIIGTVIAIVIAGAIFMGEVNDPLVNYYGTQLRESELIAYMSQNDAGHGLYCIQTSPIPFQVRSTCFNSETELNEAVAMRSALREAE